MKWLPFLCFMLITLKCFSQEKTVAGIVFEKENKERVASVSIHNITTNISVYNNLKGEFKILARAGDVLIFTRQDYKPDTVKILNNDALAIYMVRLAIQLHEVTVHDTLLSPEKRLEATKNDYTKIYGSLAYRDMLSTPSSGGAGLSIDALWNSISRSGRNAEHLRQIIQSDYEQNVIDYRFNRTYVGNITGLKDAKLTEFMNRYRPGYFITKTASEYEFVSMIRANYKRFTRFPHRQQYNLQPLISK
ncbi:hypothetical protein [Mucilaginibacter sp.]|uniref:hypothetical protein n=1 Tax=Mucilaginibacter sp. TaxID=1882438 RepID=UPI003D0F1B10